MGSFTPTDVTGEEIKALDAELRQVEADFEELQETIWSIAQAGEEVCPVTYLDVDRIEPMSAEISAPYRMDLALTYRCQNDCPHCYVGRPADFPEMSTEEWKRVIDRCWELGIPHLTFTGGTLLSRLAGCPGGVITGLFSTCSSLVPGAQQAQGQASGVHPGALADGDLPVKHENLRAFRVCRDNKTRSQIHEPSLSRFHNKPHPLRWDDQFDLPLVQRNMLVAVQPQFQRSRCDDMHSGFAKRQFD